MVRAERKAMSVGDAPLALAHRGQRVWLGLQTVPDKQSDTSASNRKES